MARKILIHIGAFAAVIALLWGALILTSLIPNEKIQGNMLTSAESYVTPDPFSFENGKKFNAVADNYADVILQNILWNIKSDDPFVSSLDTKYFDGEEFGVNWGYYASLNGYQPNTDYTRYWHGSVIFIRPLMTVTDVKGVKIVGFSAAVLLALAVCGLLVGKKQYFAASAFALSLMSVQFYNVRLSLEYLPMANISMIACIFFICLEKKGDTALTVLSVIFGAMTAFFDFLTAETLSILLPLLLVFIIREQENRLGQLRENLLLSVKCGGCWAAAYVGTFLVKWTAATAVTGENKFEAAITSAEKRFVGTAEELPFFKQLFFAPLANLSTMFGGEERVDGGKIILGLLLTALVFGGIYLLFRRRRANKPVTLICLILGLLPYLRYMVLNNHSYLHEFFTYRAQAASVLALCGIVWFNLRFSEQKNKKAAAKRR
ncbi:MAG: hypothetical protein J5999_02305 [Oscillospiraceae bacterium]|nr:hypothetical protein [Oscillospiraceae bacterium]